VDDGAFFIAYFFPRIAVYDDIDGWNEYPYTGPYEFITITVTSGRNYRTG
jgi:hypothetical protein